MPIALLTDFGTQDYFVGAMKGVILSITPDERILDITHDIPPQDIGSAGFTLLACYREFPAGTIFVAVVDPGVGSGRRAILVETAKYFFIAPDNGLLGFVFNRENDFRVFEITNEKFFRHPVSRTFHGRDIFAPAAAHLAGGTGPAEFGAEIDDFIRRDEIRPQKVSANEVVAGIIHIDRFGNLITNLTAADLPAGGFFLETGGRRITERREFFAETEQGGLFMIYGSTGFLEIAAFGDSAQNILQAAIGDTVLARSL